MSSGRNAGQGPLTQLERKLGFRQKRGDMRKAVWLSVILTVACAAQDVARMDQVVRSYAGNQRFMGTVLVARGSGYQLSTVLF